MEKDLGEKISQLNTGYGKYIMIFLLTLYRIESKLGKKCPI